MEIRYVFMAYRTGGLIEILFSENCLAVGGKRDAEVVVVGRGYVSGFLFLFFWLLLLFSLENGILLPLNNERAVETLC